MHTHTHTPTSICTETTNTRTHTNTLKYIYYCKKYYTKLKTVSGNTNANEYGMKKKNKKYPHAFIILYI